MAQKTIKNYFPSRKIQDRGKDAPTKRPIESFTVPRGKRRRVTKVFTNQRGDQSRDQEDDNKLYDIRTSFSSSSSTPTTNFHDTPSSRREATPAGANSCTAKLNCSESLPPTVSPLRRGAECVRLALGNKTSSPVTLAKDEKGVTPVFSETRRKLFSSEVASNSQTTAEHTSNEELPIPTVNKSVTIDKSDESHSASVKRPLNGISLLKNTTTDRAEKNKQVPKLKPFRSLQYDSPTKTDK